MRHLNLHVTHASFNVRGRSNVQLDALCKKILDVLRRVLRIRSVVRMECVLQLLFYAWSWYYLHECVTRERNVHTILPFGRRGDAARGESMGEITRRMHDNRRRSRESWDFFSFFKSIFLTQFTYKRARSLVRYIVARLTRATAFAREFLWGGTTNLGITDSEHSAIILKIYSNILRYNTRCITIRCDKSYTLVTTGLKRLGSVIIFRCVPFAQLSRAVICGNIK